MSDLAKEIRDLKFRSKAQTALIAALLKGTEIGAKDIHGLLGKALHSDEDVVENDQIALAMDFAQST